MSSNPAIGTRMDRRAFLTASVTGLGSLLVAPVAAAQQQAQPPTTSGPMSAEAYVPVSRVPRPGATPRVTVEQRDELERHLKCQCGCPMDIYLCRTTDFACPLSPRVHADVEALIAGGYSVDEIRDAFVAAYGERVLTAPKAEGFNLLAWVAPFAAIGTFGIFAGWLIHRWRSEPLVADGEPRIPQSLGTPDEMARLEAAVRNDGDR